MILSSKQKEDLEKKGYRFVGSHNHAAVKICHWTRKSILDQGVCYKEQFYGIKSHRCLQMSPSIPFCHHKCLFCWRDTSITSTEWTGMVDEPTEIIDGCLEAQKRLLCGFFGNSRANKKKLEESKNPNNAAISLAGEPLIYPYLNDLLNEFHKRDFTTFLVSNGLSPQKLENMSVEPTQLYISLDAPNQKIYKKLCNPQISGGWSKLNQSLNLLSSFNCRTVIRITAVKDLNMCHAEEYAKIIKNTNPKYVEIKAYMYVGSSRERLKLNNMPTFSQVNDFARSIARLCHLQVVDNSPTSRVVLLSE